MPNANLAEIKEKITAQHNGDEKQLEVIFSDCQRLIVEAPAGYGKTTTMISRIAYLFATGGIPNPKRILGLTFSVNAALKVKREIADKLPNLLGMQNSPVVIGEKITVTNYHGYCKGVLKKYGYLMTDALRKDINLFQALGKMKNDRGEIITEWRNIAKTLLSDEQETINGIDTSIENGDLPDSQAIRDYNGVVIKKLLPLSYITHNAVILFMLELFDRFAEVKSFYQCYYPLIVVDEFQDTNCIAWSLLRRIISERTKLVFLGDPLQRIYGFIGALPNIMATAADKYDMIRVALSKNYRFRDNPEMLKLDKNIRRNAASCFAPNILSEEVAKLPAFWGTTQQDEAQQVVAKVQKLINDSSVRIAILFRGRNKNAEAVEAELTAKNVPFFYGMFTDDDVDYIEIHNKCKGMFTKRFGKSLNINKKALSAFADSVKKTYEVEAGKTIVSLLRLLDALVEKVSIDYSDLQPEDKYNLLLDIFENRQLKQAMEYVDSQVVLSTVHGAKGLEWDYVILADVERWIFPGYYTCKECASKYATSSNYRCTLPSPLPTSFRETALDELSVFYVGITRARKQVFVSGSAKRLGYNGDEQNSMLSCMATLDGLKLVKADVFKSS